MKLKAVEIVKMIPANKATKSSRQLPPVKVEDKSSNGSPSLEDSEYETPGTSISTTPATSSRPVRGSTRQVKSNLSSSLLASKLGKRSRTMVQDSEDEIDDDDVDMSADAQLARQLQEEEYASAERKRFKVDDTDDDMDWSLQDTTPPPATYTGKGKGKAKAVDSPQQMDHQPTTRAKRSESMHLFDSPPGEVGFTSYSGKGKGKARALPVMLNSSKGKGKGKASDPVVLDSDDDLDLSFLDTEDDGDFDPNFEELSDLEANVDDESVVDVLETVSKKLAKVTSRASSSMKRSKTTKYQGMTATERRRARKEAAARAAQFDHIEDRWERKRAMNRARAEEMHPKLTSMWDDLQKIPVLDVQKAEQPQSITRRLKPFQLEGLSWMIRQEQTNYKGGLLGDEMGMGKTIQAVSLIMSDYPAKEPTLVLVPPVALMQWTNEIREYTDGKLKVLVYHGTNQKCKKMTTRELKQYDVIMVSYNSLESLHRKQEKGWTRGDDIIKEKSRLHEIHYHRLILDEAHSIKSRQTGVAKACFALKGTYKWCLSGTPVQNRIGEFFSLLRFLEIRPFADYFCRACACEQLHWQVDDDYKCSHCHHGMSEHISVFNQELLNPITGDDPELREGALEKLHMITARIMLRRMKRDHTNSMELPMKEIVIHNEFFSAVERDFSSSIMTNSTRKFDTYVAQGVMLNNYANIFGLIMQMRQVANHPDLLLKKHAEGGQNVLVCNVCDEPAEDAVRSRCHHEFCRACVKDFIETCEASGSDADCPRCHIPLTIDLEQPEIEQDEDQVKKTSIINRIKMENWTSSTKIEMLIYDLYKLRSKKQTLKSIVFSQFTSMLQLIEWRLRRAGFNTVMLDGSMSPAQRQKSIEYFMNNPDVEVFLVSLKAGGVALNLTEASRVFIVDP